MDSCYMNVISLRTGFWRKDNETDIIFKCIYSDLCLGGE
jgi:hypothetical protein